jgi:hypothetical protein
MPQFNPDEFGATISYIKQQYDREEGDWVKIAAKFKAAQAADALDLGATQKIWLQAIEHAKKEFADQEESERAITAAQDDATLSDYEVADVKLSTDKDSCWLSYKSKLQKRYLPSDVANLEKSAFSVLQRLVLRTQEDSRAESRRKDAVKGMVIGHVQSGKTGHLAGLMSMAADRNFNFFIVISGVIENLRLQTEKRLKEDLCGESRKWVMLTKDDVAPRRGRQPHEFLRDAMRPHSKLPERYYHVCLKNGTRLRHILQWLSKNKDVLKHLRVVIIDDEADQASVNTKKRGVDYDANSDATARNAVNSKILSLTKLSAAAVNYVGYTATPAANLLSEPPGDNTLFPRDFIRSLPESASYLGAKQIHGADACIGPRQTPGSALDGLPIIREIPIDDIHLVDEIEGGKTKRLPTTLQDSIAWFLCASAFRRALGQKTPSTMLVHTSQRQDEHIKMAGAIHQWLTTQKSRILDRCDKIWAHEKSALTKVGFIAACPTYKRPRGTPIPDYIPFKRLKTHILNMLREVDALNMEEEEGEMAPVFKSNKIHLCIDNCQFSGLDEDNNHVRLLYPSKEDFPTSFIVVGGATLSRGLTLNGLVSTYFLRRTNFGDTLMQMGRWFGYRLDYELMPRIWMTGDEMRNFRRMAYEEIDLRQAIERLVATGGNTEDYQISILTNPWFKPTAPNKMQAKTSASLDFSGSNIQTVNFVNDAPLLRRNIEKTEAFLMKLGLPSLTKRGVKSVWSSVDAQLIIGFLEDLAISERNRAFNDKKLFLKWLRKASSDPAISSWNVIAAGVKRADVRPWKVGDGINRITRSRRKRESDGDNFSIGTLLGPADRFLDFPDGCKPPDDDLKVTEIARERTRVLGSDVPQLIIYRIDKDSPAPKRTPKSGTEEIRAKLNAVEDVIGVCLLIPGERRRNNPVDRLTVRRTDLALRPDLNDANQGAVLGTSRNKAKGKKRVARRRKN